MSSSVVRIVRPASSADCTALLSAVRSEVNTTAETAGDRLVGPYWPKARLSRVTMGAAWKVVSWVNPTIVQS